jgi:hypothetical protein
MEPTSPICVSLHGTIFDAAAQQILNTFCRDKPHITHIGDIIFMRSDCIRLAFFGSLLIAATGFAAAPASAQTPYDGLWNVTVVTKTGSCEPQTSSTLTVQDGKVTAPGADVSGSVGREGLVRVSIHGAYANGQLSGNAGSGKWNGASAGIPCSGRWEASRQ